MLKEKGKANPESKELCIYCTRMSTHSPVDFLGPSRTPVPRDPSRGPTLVSHPCVESECGRTSGPHPLLRDTWTAEPQPAETRAGFIHARTSHPSILGLSLLLKWIIF